MQNLLGETLVSEIRNYLHKNFLIFFSYVHYRYLEGFYHGGTEALRLKRLSLFARQLAMHVDLILKINGNFKSFKTVLESGEDEWSFLWKSIHSPLVSVWENCCVNLVLFLMAGTPVVTSVHGHMLKKPTVPKKLDAKEKKLSYEKRKVFYFS